ALALGLLAWAAAGGPGGAQPQTKGVWTDPNDPALPADAKVQGEYVGGVRGGGRLGCPVLALGDGRFQAGLFPGGLPGGGWGRRGCWGIALGAGRFQAVVFPGGLPGDGWDGKAKILMDGRTDGGRTTFRPVAGRRRYLAQSPDEFSATSAFPPAGQADYSAAI